MSATESCGRDSAWERSGSYRLLVSGYTDSAEDPGIKVFDLKGEVSDARCGLDVSPVGESKGVNSPSFCTMSGERLYAASEMQDKGGMAAYSLDGSRVFSLESTVTFSGAAGTCYVLTSADCGMLYGADYNSGSVCFCPLGKSGAIFPPARKIQHEGHGAGRKKGDPNFDRQLGPHVHTLSFVPETKLIAAVDLGLDAIVIYETDASDKACRRACMRADPIQDR